MCSGPPRILRQAQKPAWKKPASTSKTRILHLSFVPTSIFRTYLFLSWLPCLLCSRNRHVSTLVCLRIVCTLILSRFWFFLSHYCLVTTRNLAHGDEESGRTLGVLLMMSLGRKNGLMWRQQQQQQGKYRTQLPEINCDEIFHLHSWRFCNYFNFEVRAPGTLSLIQPIVAVSRRKPHRLLRVETYAQQLHINQPFRAVLIGEIFSPIFSIYLFAYFISKYGGVLSHKICEF